MGLGGKDVNVCAYHDSPCNSSYCEREGPGLLPPLLAEVKQPRGLVYQVDTVHLVGSENPEAFRRGDSFLHFKCEIGSHREL